MEGSRDSARPTICSARNLISSLVYPLRAFDLATLEAIQSTCERSDAGAVPAAGVVAEAVVVPVIANALLEKIGGDHMAEIVERLEAYREMLRVKFGG